MIYSLLTKDQYRMILILLIQVFSKRIIIELCQHTMRKGCWMWRRKKRSNKILSKAYQAH
jgi:hypothetical protein